MPTFSFFLFYGWLLFIVVLLPVWAYKAARKRDVSAGQLMMIALCLLIIPASIGGYALIANTMGISLDFGSNRNVYDTPREFFIALGRAQKPYENTVFALIFAQAILALFAPLFLKLKRVYALAIGVSGLHLSIIFGFIMLNVLLGEWPRS